MTRAARGFSLIEVLMVIAIVLVGASVSVIQLRSSLAIMDADEAVNLVSSQIRYARQISVDQRRNVELEFIGNDQVRVTRQDGDGDETIMADVTLPSGFSFSMPEDIGDTPDAFGNATPVYFNVTTTGGIFQADGSFNNSSGIVTSGTVFTMGGNSGSARAVTLTGASGRTKVYWLQGTTWVERN